MLKYTNSYIYIHFLLIYIFVFIFNGVSFYFKNESEYWLCIFETNLVDFYPVGIYSWFC